MQRLVAATAFSVLLAASAAAQTTNPAPAPSATTAGQPSYSYRATADDQRASKLIGTTVKNNAGESIGDVNEILLGKDGKVAAVIIGVGGFLGLGEREIAVPFGSLQVSRDSNDNVVAMLPNATKDSLKAAPEWKWPTRS